MASSTDPLSCLRARKAQDLTNRLEGRELTTRAWRVCWGMGCAKILCNLKTNQGQAKIYRDTGDFRTIPTYLGGVFSFPFLSFFLYLDSCDVEHIGSEVSALDYQVPRYLEKHGINR